MCGGGSGDNELDGGGDGELAIAGVIDGRLDGVDPALSG